MFILNKNATFLFIISFIILLYMVLSSNHINTLILFFIGCLLFYSYAYSINCNWISLIIILWYARRITVLFYLLACYNSSISYFNIYNNKTLYYNSVKVTNIAKNTNKGIVNKLVTGWKKAVLENKKTKARNEKTKEGYFLFVPMLPIYFSYFLWIWLSCYTLNFLCKYLSPGLFSYLNFNASLVYNYIKDSFFIIWRNLKYVFRMFEEITIIAIDWWRQKINQTTNLPHNTNYDEIIYNPYSTTITYDFLKPFMRTYNSSITEFKTSPYFINLESTLSTISYSKPIYFKYTNFIDIYSAIISTPSSLFLTLFFLPVFTYVVYFVCNFLSYRNKEK